MNTKFISFALVLFLGLGFVLGCDKKDPIAPLSGKVTLDGKPIADCLVSFQPTSDNALVAASGVTDAQGNFSLQTIESPQRTGAALGKYTVKFFWRDPDFNESNPAPAPYKIPDKFQQTGVIFEVPAGGKTDVVFEL